MAKLCKVCNLPIEEGRLRALKNNTDTCIAHSTAVKFAGVSVVRGNKGADDGETELIIIRDPKSISELRIEKELSAETHFNQ